MNELRYILRQSYMIIGQALLSTERATLLQVLNPPIYLISVLPGVCVWLLHPQVASVLLLVMATVAVILLQHAINLHNDVTDWHRGTDPDKFLSWARYYDGHTEPLMRQAHISLLAGGCLGLLTLYLANRLEILILATPLVLAGYLYNAGKTPLSYTRYGEWVTAICYGPGVFGCLWWLSSLEFSSSTLLGGIFGSLAFAALAASILLSHQPPQIDSDGAVDKISYAVRYGSDRTYFMARLLFSVFGLSLLGLNLLINASTATLVAIIAGTSTSLFFLLKVTPCPPRVLIPATLIISANVLLSF